MAVATWMMIGVSETNWKGVVALEDLALLEANTWPAIPQWFRRWSVRGKSGHEETVAHVDLVSRERQRVFHLSR